jgi:hypothetical protein
MRRTGQPVSASLAPALALAVCALLLAPALAAQINPRLPPPPPPPEIPGPENIFGPLPWPAYSPEEILVHFPAPDFDLPERVTLAAGSSVEVILETPMSTRLSHAGQKVAFRTTQSIPVSDTLMIPPDAFFHGSVSEMKKPGGFGKPGILRVKVERIALPEGASVPVVARLEAADVDSQGRIRGESAAGTNIYQVAQWGLSGVLIGGRSGGGKGAAIGGGAGALAALIIMMASKGRDLYVEPGTPFQIVLERPAELPGADVYVAQRNYAERQRRAAERAAASASAETSESGMAEKEKPGLKRRPRRGT